MGDQAQQVQEMPVKVRPHPAKFSKELFGTIRGATNKYLDTPGWVLDPFGGVGLVHEIFDDPSWHTLAIEIEEQWAEQSALRGETWHGDFFEWEIDRKVAAVVTSPTYGNRMADHHEAKDLSYRATYRHALGQPLHPNNSGGMQWGVEYRSFHIKAWARVYEILSGGGVFVLNIKNHVRKGEVVDVVGWHRRRAIALGFTLLEDIEVPTPGMRYGENGAARVDCEHVLVFGRERSASTWSAASVERKANLATVADMRYLTRAA